MEVFSNFVETVNILQLLMNTPYLWRAEGLVGEDFVSITYRTMKKNTHCRILIEGAVIHDQQFLIKHGHFLNDQTKSTYTVNDARHFLHVHLASLLIGAVDVRPAGFYDKASTYKKEFHLLKDDSGKWIKVDAKNNTLQRKMAEGSNDVLQESVLQHAYIPAKYKTESTGLHILENTNMVQSVVKVLIAKNEKCALFREYTWEQRGNGIHNFSFVLKESKLVVCYNYNGVEVEKPYEGVYAMLIKLPEPELDFKLLYFDDIDINIVGNEIHVSHPDQIEVIEKRKWTVGTQSVFSFKMQHKIISRTSNIQFVTNIGNKTIRLAAVDPLVKEAYRQMQVFEHLVKS